MAASDGKKRDVRCAMTAGGSATSLRGELAARILCRLVFVASVAIGQLSGAFAQSPLRPPHVPLPLGKGTVDDYRHFHNVGNLGLTVTNYGLLGQGYQVALKEQPSCQYKLHSRLDKERIEHFSYAGLWVGGIGGAQGEQKTLVSTAIVDGVFQYGEAGFEFTTSPDEADTVRERSTIITSPHFHPAAISHQDFLCDFTDRNVRVPGTQIEILEHTPLGIDVHLESYAWNYSFADAFVILNYTIKNVSRYPIERVYVGLWVDASVANMNYTSRYEPGGGFTWYDNLNGFDAEYNMAYQYDADGDNGYAESYLGIRALGASVPRGTYKVHYNQWKWNTAANAQFPDYFMPRDDTERYQKMSSTPPPPVPNQPDSWMILLSMGPLGDLAPGDSVNAVFAVVCGFWGPGEGDSPERRKNLRLNSDWAQIAYNGEDVDGDGRLDQLNEDLNGNGILDPGEDVDGDGHLDIDEDVYHNPQRGIYAHNGRLDRYILPSPPPSPRLLALPGPGRVELYWDNLPELTEDPITREIDFEGYRVYGSPKTRGSQEEYSLLAQFDLKNNLGYDTGLQLIRHDTLIDGTQYHYRFVNEMLHDGWPGRYFYSVTAFDRGNPANNLPSLESSVYENLTYVIPGTQASAGELKVYVYPNPYRGGAVWDGRGERQRLIWFANLPLQAVIRIYTLAGDLVDEIHHDGRHYAGEDVARLTAVGGGKEVKFPGGMHAWDLITRNDQAIASGLYLYTVEDKSTGQIYTGKFLVIK
ncbi:MAG: hypothetical protein ONB25_02550 [candidate division KSB1 bacterium]|nr:hypothetical protein [candidate division KSB1 bacterium]